VRSAEGPIPIGRPIARTSVHVLDARGQHVPLGVPGELFIGGAGVARGYLDRPELTSERFVESPFEPGSTLYRTGDLVRIDSSGVLLFERRVDKQVKVRGHRIELEEIESVLSAEPGVRECVVLVRQDDGAAATDVKIVAYVGTSGAAVSAKDLRARIGDRLPAYMVPHHFVTMDALPRTPNGKVDARALPVPSGGRGQAERAFVPAVTDTERTLCALWAELLEVQQVGGADDFFELGGHSLLATRMLARVTEQFGVEVGLRQLFKAKTVSALAGHIDELRLRTAEVPGPVSSSSFEEVVL
jgi:acyl carrier protein